MFKISFTGFREAHAHIAVPASASPNTGIDG